MSGILEGVKVLDFGRYIAGPFCGALLADYGAEVIRIERVSGSEDRYVTPVTEDGQGAMFLQLKEHCTLSVFCHRCYVSIFTSTDSFYSDNFCTIVCKQGTTKGSCNISSKI